MADLNRSAKKMRYGSTQKATDFRPADWRIKLVKAALFFVPEANPDSEKLYPKVKKWLLEVHDDGSAVRELALDGEGCVLFRAPEGRNVGFWTDSDAKFSEADLIPVSAEQFESLWANARRK